MRYGFLAFVVLALAGLAAVGYLRASSEIEQGGGRGFGGRATNVEVATIARADFADVVQAIGDARANESVTITSQVTDVISRVAFDSGDVVVADQVLAELADAEEAAGLNEARSSLAEARRELQRFTDLSERGVASRSQIDELSSSVDQAQARVRALEARLADRIIRAPFDGVVGLRNASPGMLVRPGDAIAVLDDVSIIKLDFTVPERFITSLREGADIEAAAAAFADETFRGTITNIDSRVDPVTRTIIARAAIDNSDARLRPGMLMVVELRQNVRTTPAAPELAVFRQGDRAFVYVVEEGENGFAAQRRSVETGARSGGFIEIRAGLEPGEEVVSEGVHRVRPGAPVRVARRDGEAVEQERRGPNPAGGRPGLAAGAGALR